MLTAGLALLGIAAALSEAEETSSDKWKPAGTQIKLASTDTVFTMSSSLGNVEQKCQLLAFEGTTPGTAPGAFADQLKIEAGVPKFQGCNETTTAGTAKWKVELHSGTLQKVQLEECEKASEEGGVKKYNAATEDDDCVTIIVPKEAAVIKGLCEITLAPVQSFSMTGYYDDDGQQGEAKFNSKIPAEGKPEFGCKTIISTELKSLFKVFPLVSD